MTIIKWESTYETGIEKIDNHHRGFVKMIIQLEKSLMSSEAEAEAHDVLVKLVKYVRYHFAAEEMMMAENRYSRTDHHAGLHQQFIHGIAKLLNKLKNTGKLSPSELLLFLKNHLLDHIVSEDSKLRFLKLEPARIK